MWKAGLQYHVAPMDKQHYYFKLIPPRPSFPQDMTSEERALMEKHSAYFRQHFDLGKLLLYGPVMALRERSVWESWRSPTRRKLGGSAKMIPRSVVA